MQSRRVRGIAPSDLGRQPARWTCPRRSGYLPTDWRSRRDRDCGACTAIAASWRRPAASIRPYVLARVPAPGGDKHGRCAPRRV